MEKLKDFTVALSHKLVSLIEDNNLKQAYEVGANIMVGGMITIMALMMIVAWIINAVGIFTVHPVLMREATLICIAVSSLLSYLNRRFRGDRPWLKYVLEIGLILECGALSSILGHDVTLVTVIPAILAIRYFDEKFSLKIVLITAVVFFFSTIICARIGLVNLNLVPYADGTTLVIQGGLRDTIEAAGFDRREYAFSYLRNDYLPKALSFVIISLACIGIAKRGRQTLELQDQISSKSARITTELNLAKEIQSNMLPCTLPPFPEHCQLELFAKNRPAKEVGGDFYDYFRIDDDHVAVLIADVSGKGVGAALFMMIAKTIIKNQLQTGISPAEAMTIANEQLCENNTTGIFVTVWVSVYEVSSGKLRYVNAGHNPPILKKDGETCVYLRGKTGFVIAGMEGIKYRQNELELKPGDELFLYTDGVTEATDKDNRLFGEERLLEVISRINSESVKQQILDVFDEIDRFAGGVEQFDDITMLGLKVHDEDVYNS